MVARGRTTKFGLKQNGKITTRHNGNTSTKDISADEVIAIVKEKPLFYVPFKGSKPKVTHVTSVPAVVHALKNPRNIIWVDLGEKSTDDKIKWSLKIGEEVSKAVTSGELHDVKKALKRIGVVDGGRKGSAEAYRRVIIDKIDKMKK